MASETLTLDSVLSSTFTGATVANLNADDASWATAADNNTSGDVHVTMENPVGGSLTSGANLQTITVHARQTAGSGTGTPTLRIEVWEAGGGAALAASSELNVASAAAPYTFTWDASILAAASGANVEIKVFGTKSGGSPAVRASVDIGYIVWTADVSASTNVTASGTSTQADVTQSGGSASGEQFVTASGDNTQADVTQSGGSASGEVNVTASGGNTQADVTHVPGSVDTGGSATVAGTSTQADVTQSGGSASGEQHVSPAGSSTQADVTQSGGSAEGVQSTTASGSSTQADVTQSGGSADAAANVTQSGDTTQADVSQTGGDVSLSSIQAGDSTQADVSHSAGSAEADLNAIGEGGSTTADVSQSGGTAIGGQDTVVAGDTTAAIAGSRQVQSVVVSLPSNATLAGLVTDALTRWNAQMDQIADWLTGEVWEGPNSDGKFPLTNAQGESELFPGLKFILDQVSGPKAAAEVAQAAAEAAQTLAASNQAAAEAAKTAAEVALASAQTLRDETFGFRQDVAADHAAVNTWQAQVAANATAAATSEANAATSEANAATSEANAAASAAAAATFDPASYYLKTESDALYKAIGYTPTWSEITGKPSTFTPSAHTHLWVDITDKPSTFAPSAHTHLWADITDKPSTFAPSAHTHLWADITDKPSTFAPSAHSHAIADVTGLQTALDGKATSSHVHTIGDVTGLQTALDGKLDTSGGTISGVTHVQNQFNIGGGGANGLTYIRDSANSVIGVLQASSTEFKIGSSGGSRPLQFTTGGTVKATLDINGNLTLTGGDLQMDNAKYYKSKAFAGGSVRMLGINASDTAYVGPIDAGPTSTVFNASSTSASAAFYTSGTEKLRINSAGNVGIGTTSPSEKLDVVGNAEINGNLTVNGNAIFAGGSYVASNGDVFARRDNATTGVYYFATGGDRYLYFNGTQYVFGGSYPLLVNGRNVLNDIDGKAPLANPTFSGTVTTGSNTSIVMGTGAKVSHNADDNRDKLRVWSNAPYSIGMDNLYTFGALGNDYAMTFQMSNTATRGWWWGDAAHTNAQGAMSLTTEGKLAVATGIRVGFGESDTSFNNSFDFDCNGPAQFNNTVSRYNQGAFMHHGSSSHASGKITVSASAPSGGADGDIWLQV